MRAKIFCAPMILEKHPELQSNDSLRNYGRSSASQGNVGVEALTVSEGRKYANLAVCTRDTKPAGRFDDETCRM